MLLKFSRRWELSAQGAGHAERTRRSCTHCVPQPLLDSSRRSRSGSAREVGLPWHFHSQLFKAAACFKAHVSLVLWLPSSSFWLSDRSKMIPEAGNLLTLAGIFIITVSCEVSAIGKLQSSHLITFFFPVSSWCMVLISNDAWCRTSCFFLVGVFFLNWIIIKAVDM